MPETNSGDEAKGHLYEKYTPLVRAIVSRILRDWPSEWDDACQTAFLLIFSKKDGFRKKCPFDKWVGAVAANTAISVRRQLLREGKIRKPMPDDPSDHRRQVDPALADCIERTVAKFKPEWQQVVNLIENGLSRERIAEKLGRSRKAIQNWLVHMRERLLPCVGG